MYVFAENPDFFYLLSGLAFMLIAAESFLLRRADAKFAWRALLYFAFFGGMHQWLELLRLDLNQEWDIGVRTFSFLCLLVSGMMLWDFGLASTGRFSRIFRGVIYIALLSAVWLLFRSYDLDGLYCGCRMIFIIPGTIVAGSVFAYRGLTERTGLVHPFVLLAGLFPAYGLATWKNCRQALSGWISGGSFQSIDMQFSVVSLMLLLAMVFVLSFYCCRSKSNNPDRKCGQCHFLKLMIVLLLIGVFNYMFLNYWKRNAGNYLVNDLIKITKMLSARDSTFVELRNLLDRKVPARQLVRRIDSWCISLDLPLKYDFYVLSEKDELSYLCRCSLLGAKSPKISHDRKLIMRLKELKRGTITATFPVSGARDFCPANIAEIVRRDRGSGSGSGFRYYFMLESNIIGKVDQAIIFSRIAVIAMALVFSLAILIWIAYIDNAEGTRLLTLAAARYRSLIEMQKDIIIRFDQDCRLTFANDVFCQKTGFPRDKLFHCRLDDIPLCQVFKEGFRRSDSFKWLQKHVPDKREEWIEWHITPVMGDDGHFMEFQCVGRDITELQNAIKANQESEKKYRQLVDLANEGIWAIDRNNVTTFANRKMAEMLGTSVEELLGKSLFAFVAESEVGKVEYNLERRRGGISEQHDFAFLRADGKTICTSLSTTAMYDDDGNYAGALAVVVDISRFRELEKDLKEMMKELQATLNFSQLVSDTDPNIIFVKDHHGKIIMVNRAMAELFGLKTSEIVGLGWDELTRKTFIFPSFKEADDQVLHSMKTIEYDEKIKMADGRIFWFRITKTPFSLADGNTGILIIGVDITRRKNVEQALNDTNKTLETTVIKRTNLLNHTVQRLSLEVEEKQKLQLILQEESERIQEQLGQDLHDVLGQTLTAISIKAAVLSKTLEDRYHERNPVAEQIVGYAGEAIVQMRNIAKALSSISLCRRGLEVELYDFKSFITHCFDVEIALDIDSAVITDLPGDVQKSLFRIIQESVMNGIRHGKCKIVELTIRRSSNNCAILSIRNDGQKISDKKGAGGIGTMIMKNRAKVIGASLEVNNLPEGGVETICRFRFNSITEGGGNGKA